jgi:hypothetical protein
MRQRDHGTGSCMELDTFVGPFHTCALTRTWVEIFLDKLRCSMVKA